MKTKPLPSQKTLHELFNYDPCSGLFTYKKKPNFRIKIGSIAGTVKKTGKCKGYCFIKVDGQLYQASRLAWMYVYGEDPGELTIDHVDHNPSNNAIDNLRLATLSQQSFNRRTFNKDEALRGVWFNANTGKYIVNLNFRKAGIRTSRSFGSEMEAINFYNEQRKLYGGEFAICK